MAVLGTITVVSLNRPLIINLSSKTITVAMTCKLQKKNWMDLDKNVTSES